MALEGTLDTVSLPEVLRLLAAGRTGRLRLEGQRGVGTIDVRGGRVAAAETARTGVVDVATELVEPVFELLRWEAGTFSFTPADGPADGEELAAGAAVDDLLEQASARLARWREVEAVVPSVACPVEVVEELKAPEATVPASTWPVLVAAARSTTVADVGDRLAMDEVGASTAVRALVDAGFARVGSAPAGGQEPAPVPRPASSEAPVEPGPGPDGGGDGSASDQGVALLRRLTGAEWTWVDDGAGGRKLQRGPGGPGPAAVPEWAVEGAVAAAPVAPVVAPLQADGPPAPVAEPSPARAGRTGTGLASGPDWADDEALDEAFAGWEPGPSAEAHPLERALVLPGPEHPEPPAMGEHRLLERLLGTLRA